MWILDRVSGWNSKRCFTPPHSGGCREIPEDPRGMGTLEEKMEETVETRTKDGKNSTVGVAAQSLAGQKITIAHVSLQW